MPRSIAAALALAGVALLLSAGESGAGPSCVVTDNNPCSAPGGPWREGAVAAAPKRNILRTYRSASALRSCLTAQTRAILAALEARVGRVSIISTCRPGAVIAGTRRPSFHRYGMAVDFATPRKAEAVAFLRSQPVLVMTYRNMGHVHFNVGQKGAVFAADAHGRRRAHWSARRKGRR